METIESKLFGRMSEKRKDQFRQQSKLLASGKCPVNDRDKSTPRLDAITNGRKARNKLVMQDVAEKIGYDFDEVRTMSNERIEEILNYGY